MAEKVAIMQSPPEIQPGQNQGYSTANNDQVKMPPKNYRKWPKK